VDVVPCTPVALDVPCVAADDAALEEVAAVGPLLEAADELEDEGDVEGDEDEAAVVGDEDEAAVVGDEDEVAVVAGDDVVDATLDVEGDEDDEAAEEALVAEVATVGEVVDDATVDVVPSLLAVVVPAATLVVDVVDVVAVG